MLLDQIKKDSIVARKVRNTDRASILTTLFSEAQMIGKDNGNRETTDSEVIQIVKKFLKGIDEMISIKPTASLIYEKEILLAYLPIQLREDELTVVINDIIETSGFSSMKDMGKVMGLLKEKFEGQFDGKIASKIVRETLT